MNELKLYDWKNEDAKRLGRARYLLILEEFPEMRWPWQLEEDHYDALRDEALEPHAKLDDKELWINSSIGAWLPPNKRADYIGSFLINKEENDFDE